MLTMRKFSGNYLLHFSLRTTLFLQRNFTAGGFTEIKKPLTLYIITQTCFSLISHGSFIAFQDFSLPLLLSISNLFSFFRTGYGTPGSHIISFSKKAYGAQKNYDRILFHNSYTTLYRRILDSTDTASLCQV